MHQGVGMELNLLLPCNELAKLTHWSWRTQNQAKSIEMGGVDEKC